MSRLPATFYIGQTDKGCVHYIAVAAEGVFLWGAHPHWEKTVSTTLRDAAGVLHIKKVEKLKPVDVPLFLLRTLELDEPEPCTLREKS